MAGSILLVDDEAPILALLSDVLEEDGHRVEIATDSESAIERLKAVAFDLIVTDLKMPVIDGLELVSRAKKILPDCGYILMTAYGTVETARRAFKYGVIDYLTKPFSPTKDLRPLVLKALGAGGEAPRPEPPSAEDPPWTSPLVAQSAAMRATVARLQSLGQTCEPVLLVGPPGVGKTRLAELLHRLSDRPGTKPIRVEAASATPDLEARLFGPGGVWDEAVGSSLILEDLDEVSGTLQRVLARRLDSEVVCEPHERVHLVATISCEPSAGRNRPALASELHAHLERGRVAIPPLRERPEDIRELVRLALVELADEAPKKLGDDASQALECYPWPGNVKELLDTVERAVWLSEGEQIALRDLPLAVQAHRPFPRAAFGAEPVDHLESLEIRTILSALVQSRFQRGRAAEMLGITRRALIYRIEKYELEGSIDALMVTNQPAPSAEDEDGRQLSVDLEPAQRAALDLMPLGVVLVDRAGRVAAANRPATEITLAEDGISLESGRLKLANPAEDGAFDKLLSLGPGANGHEEFVRASRPSGQPPLLLRVSWLGTARSVDPLAAVILCDPMSGATVSEIALRKLHDLTPTEARLAARLAMGVSLAEAAVAMGIRESTARDHLKRVFSKIGCHRQSQLVRMILSGPAIAGSPGQDPR